MPSVSSWFEAARLGDKGRTKTILVIGLGRFGTALASSLVDLGIEVLAIDRDADLVNAWSGRLTHVMVADATKVTALTQLGAAEFDAAVVAIGTSVEASVLATAALGDAGATNIWAKAMSDEHRRILERVGADHVVQPERDMGERVSHVVSGQVIDYFPLDETFVLAEIEAPAALVGKSLGASRIRDRFDVTVVCIKPRGGKFTYTTADTEVASGDFLLVAGRVADTERFSRLQSASVGS